MLFIYLDCCHWSDMPHLYSVSCCEFSLGRILRIFHHDQHKHHALTKGRGGNTASSFFRCWLLPPEINLYCKKNGTIKLDSRKKTGIEHHWTPYLPLNPENQGLEPHISDFIYWTFSKKPIGLPKVSWNGAGPWKCMASWRSTWSWERCYGGFHSIGVKLVLPSCIHATFHAFFQKKHQFAVHCTSIWCFK